MSKSFIFNRRGFFIAAILACLASTTYVAQACFFYPTVIVTVLNKNTNQPVSGCTVKLNTMTLTASSTPGVYVAGIAPPGSYSLKITHPSYKNYTQYVSVGCTTIESFTAKITPK